jgi:PDZ domain
MRRILLLSLAKIVGGNPGSPATRQFRHLALAVSLPIFASGSRGVEIPSGSLSNLSADQFRTRKHAEAEILAWARQRPAPAMDAIYGHSRTSPDPEVRERCLSILRDLVADEYLRDGEGYIGIRMQDEITNVPGDPKPRGAIRVIQVVAGSAAESAGLQLNDLIVGLNEEIWHERVISFAFGDRIRHFKPNAVVNLKVLRAGNLIELPVKLGRRPLFAENPFIEQTEEEIAEAEKAAQAAHFKRWLEDRRKRD